MPCSKTALLHTKPGRNQVLVCPCTAAGNPDAQDPRYSSELGVYDRHCGLANVAMSWGHDEYLWLVLQGNGCTLPEQVNMTPIAFRRRHMEMPAWPDVCCRAEQ